MSYEYDSAGRRTKRALQNSTFTVLEYDNASQVTNIWHRQISGGSTNTISQYRYGYDDAGSRTWVKRASGKGDVYKYDATDQLTNVLYEATNPDATPSAWTNEVSYFFDAAGNRTSVIVTNTGTTSYVANALNQYTNMGGSTPSYDANGNLSSYGGLNLTYDRENHLTRAQNGITYRYYGYDAFGRLVLRDYTDVSFHGTVYYYDGWQLIAEYEQNNSTKTLKAKYVYGPGIDEVVRMTRDGTNYYYHAAALDTVAEITSTNGTLVEQYRYDVYGTPQFYDGSGNAISGSAIGNRLLFQGRDRDPDTGLYNFRHRYYSPTLGRFVQVDPIGVAGGLNAYSFVNNRPANGVDPLGLAEQKRKTDNAQSIEVKKCEVVILVGHGHSERPHWFTPMPNNKCWAAGFIGCYAGTTNKRIPEDQRIPGSPVWDDEISSKDEEYTKAWQEMQKGADSKANEICSKCDCPEVTITYLYAPSYEISDIAKPSLPSSKKIPCDK